MIALKNGLPLVRGAEGNSTAFDGEWLHATLARAAAKAGYYNWCLVDDLVKVVSLYFQYGYNRCLIDLIKLEKAVQKMLREIGYEEVAVCFQPAMP